MFWWYVLCGQSIPEWARLSKRIAPSQSKTCSHWVCSKFQVVASPACNVVHIRVWVFSSDIWLRDSPFSVEFSTVNLVGQACKFMCWEGCCEVLRHFTQWLHLKEGWIAQLFHCVNWEILFWNNHMLCVTSIVMVVVIMWKSGAHSGGSTWTAIANYGRGAQFSVQVWPAFRSTVWNRFFYSEIHSCFCQLPFPVVEFHDPFCVHIDLSTSIKESYRFAVRSIHTLGLPIFSVWDLRKEVYPGISCFSFDSARFAPLCKILMSAQSQRQIAPNVN